MKTKNRILLIEDSASDAELLIYELKKSGFDPDWTRVIDADELEKMLNEKDWDLILCDYGLPKFTGLDAIKMIKKINPDIPVILVSGMVGEEKAVEVMRAGANDYILKDNLTRLALAVNRELKEYKSKKEAEIREMEFKKQLILAKDKAEESDRLKTAFLANMSHELRTPMNVVLGFTEILKDDTLPVEERRNYLELIHQSGNTMVQLLSDIMDISKIESGSMTIIKEKNIIHDLIIKLYSKFLKEMELKDKSHIKLRKVIPDSGRNIILNSDKLRLIQVFNNIFQNAMKFTNEGTIEMGYSVKGNKIIQFYIKDTGIGIEENKKEIIFERFRMTDETMTRRFAGAGLGLSISKNIITMLNGEIRVESAVGKGSTFYFTIPVDSSDIMLNQNNGESIEKPGSAGTDLSGKTILVVEDEDANYLLIETLLRKYNPKIIQAIDGLEAIRVTQSQDNPDLILMDIRLPRLNGLEATKKIREFNPEVPIIALTAYAFSEDKEKAFAAGCNDFITKPIKHDQLIEKINMLISQTV